MKSSGTSDKYQNNNLKTIIAFGRFLEPTISLQIITKRDQIIAFLDTKIKNSQVDPDKRWITTWNDYLGRIKYFFRWLHNTENSGRLLRVNLNHGDNYIPITEWKTPTFLKIDKKKTKRLSPYLETLFHRYEIAFFLYNQMLQSKIPINLTFHPDFVFHLLPKMSLRVL